MCIYRYVLRYTPRRVVHHGGGVVVDLDSDFLRLNINYWTSIYSMGFLLV